MIKDFLMFGEIHHPEYILLLEKRYKEDLINESEYLHLKQKFYFFQRFLYSQFYFELFSRTKDKNILFIEIKNISYKKNYLF